MLEAVPEAGLQVAMKAALGPPVSATLRSVSGRSGSPVNVVVPWLTLTAPVSVSANGGGKTSTSWMALRLLSEPIR